MNVTIVDNNSNEGGALYFWGGTQDTVQVLNSIILNNTIPQITFANQDQLTFNSLMITNSSIPDIGINYALDDFGRVILNQGVIFLNPLLDSNHKLSFYSPSIGRWH